jgi:membrane protease YdiL (CAAX protease family)
VNGAEAAPYAAAAAGLAVLVWWAVRVRTGRDPLGARPAGEWPDTGLALALGLPAWYLAPWGVVTALAPLGLSEFSLTTAVGVARAVVAIVLLRFVGRGTPAPTVSGRRLVVAGCVSGLVVYGVVGVVGQALTAGYEICGVTLPEQGVVALARQATGADVAQIVVTSVVLAPFAEEVFWRGTLLPALLRSGSAGTAILVQGAVFGAMHFADDPRPAMWPLAIPLALVGVLAGWIYVRTGSLAVPILLHAVFNGLTVAFLRSSA